MDRKIRKLNDGSKKDKINHRKAHIVDRTQ
jgi:hypothetical protein